ncbi:heme-binding protein [uncultured Thiocystis sp.]|jgi:hypothetical protein|uniref:SOUL family heme-binding protein n=1 Tax=uncultured Thiocystis sp. TaxID=1202134 RepID=UPI0025E2E0B5|nr:heme-binding protein [uncultured Thiocystis sp.]
MSTLSEWPVPAALVALLLTLPGGETMAIEEPTYETIRQGPDIELRRYRPILLAETQVSGDFDAVGGTAFRILADYIFGNNQGRERIAMTAPVNQRPASGAEPGTGTRIEMTAPVTQRSTDPARNAYVISFLMPARFTLATLPRPKDSRVMLREEPARLMAVLRYSGSWAESRYREHEERLLAAVRAAGLTPLGDPLYARYNSPFSLPFLRRNEVMVEVAEPGLP